jgi:hypothetical protein
MAALGLVMAEQVRGRIGRTNIHDKAKLDMLGAVVMLNRAGIITRAYQNGAAPNRTGVERRAVFSGFADTATKDWLDDVLWGSPYTWFAIYDLYDPAKPEYASGRYHRGGGLPAARRHQAGRVYHALTDLGGQMDAGQIRRAYPVQPQVHAELCAAWQITIYDRDWGPSGLFEFLFDAAAQRVATLSEVEELA